MEIRKSDAVASLLESQNIHDEELIAVITRGEEEGKKFFHPETGRFLASARLGEATYHVIYSVQESQAIVHNAYWHKSEVS